VNGIRTKKFNQDQEKIIKKRIKEITIIRYRRRVTKSQTESSASCPICGSQELITVATAAQLTGLSPSTLYQWIASQKIHYIRSAHNKLLVCCKSLSECLTSFSETNREVRTKSLPP
jgi:excisionase family DNA binding protein